MISIRYLMEMSKKRKAQEAIIQPSGDTKIGEDTDLEEAHQVVAKTKEGETMRSAVYPTKKQAMDMHYKMAKITST